jgi:hypothetical protein
MRKALALCMLIGMAGCAGSPPAGPPAGAPSALNAPEIRAGDEWAYAFRDGYTGLPRGTVRYQVTGVADHSVQMEVEHAGRRTTEIYTRDLNWLMRPMTNLQDFRYEPPYPALPFPLAVGKTWRAHVRATDPSTGRANRVRVDGRVLGWERVRVPAGEFDALKVRRLVYAGNFYFSRGEEHITEIDWYAPQLGQVVRRESFSHHLDTSRGCDDDRGDCQIVKGDWNVFELLSHRRGGTGG